MLYLYKMLYIYIECLKKTLKQAPGPGPGGTALPGIDPPAQRCRWASGSSPPWRRPTLDHHGDHGIANGKATMYTNHQAYNYVNK